MQRMRAVQAADDAKRAAAHAKNDLESYIIGTRSALQARCLIKETTLLTFSRTSLPRGALAGVVLDANISHP